MKSCGWSFDDADFGLKARPYVQIRCPNLYPGIGALIDVQPAAQAYAPPRACSQFSIVDLTIELPDELHTGVCKTFAE